MEIGDVCRIRGFKKYFKSADRKGFMQYTPKRGKYFVVMILGMESDENFGKLIPGEMLQKMGWKYKG